MATITLTITAGSTTTNSITTLSDADAARITAAFEKLIVPRGGGKIPATQQGLGNFLLGAMVNNLHGYVARNETTTPALPAFTAPAAPAAPA